MFGRKSKHDFDISTVIKGCLRKKHSSQKALFEQYYGFAKSIALRYASNNQECDEMLQDGFIKVFDQLEKYDSKHSFEAWLRTVVVRTCIDYHRKYHTKYVMEDIDEIYYLSYDDDMLDRLSAEEILELVQQLSPAYRMVFSLYIVEGYAHAEIAQMMNINESTSRSNLAKAKMKMQELVKRYYEDIKDYKNVR